MANKSVYDVLVERGFLAQTTHEDTIREKLSKPGVTFYTGFDPTADSLHVGHMITLMMMAHMQRAGHRPIALVGGGTAMIGDPSGRTDMRSMMSKDTIEHNAQRFKAQMQRFIDFTDDKAILVNNADWLTKFNYIDFIRDYGAHFSVNRMLTAECYRSRLERGLTFLEFNYMLLQGYDFLELFRRYNCDLQLGGDDQWSNILAGIDLIRRVEQKEAYGATVNLLLNSEGVKMGKTAKGAVWLDENKMSVFDFYQYWRNVGDSEVIKCLKLLTFVDMAEINEYAKLEGAELNQVKQRLAYEITAIVHGEEKAAKAQQQALDLFSGAGRSEDMPTIEVAVSSLPTSLLDVLSSAKVFASKSEARRMFQQNGVYLNDNSDLGIDYQLTEADFSNNEAIVRRGKKKFFRLQLI